MEPGPYKRVALVDVDVLERQRGVIIHPLCAAFRGGVMASGVMIGAFVIPCLECSCFGRTFIAARPGLVFGC